MLLKAFSFGIPSSSFALFVLIAAGACSLVSAQEETMIQVAGGTFLMGDLFGEGLENERPIHQVKLSDYLLSASEVTVGQFRAFVRETGYRTSAESASEPERHNELERKLMQKSEFDEEALMMYREVLSYGGCQCFQAHEGPGWKMEPDATWANPHFPQQDDHPVTCVSWNDAASYSNWLSRNEGLPVAYDLITGDLLDAKGEPTTDVSKVVGYRLPTEAEWEYAARERGRMGRFGNGEDIARPSEINFDARRDDFSHMEAGEWRRSTVPVGSFKPNSLGLYDMSGNVWEWCSDYLRAYSQEDQTNPYGSLGSRRAARGGRWGGGASELRTSMRFGWPSEDRCNNIGFRVARTLQAVKPTSM